MELLLRLITIARPQIHGIVSRMLRKYFWRDYYLLIILLFISIQLNEGRMKSGMDLRRLFLPARKAEMQGGVTN